MTARHTAAMRGTESTFAKSRPAWHVVLNAGQLLSSVGLQTSGRGAPGNSGIARTGGAESQPAERGLYHSRTWDGPWPGVTSSLGLPRSRQREARAVPTA
jgi:hypothetical protein